MPSEERGPWRRMRLWTTVHAIDDMYQGLVPASVPYFVLDRHYSYVAASGLTLAATLGSSLPQPAIGLLVDKWRMGWMAPAGVSLAGAGAGLSGLAPAYPVVWLLLLAAGPDGRNRRAPFLVLTGVEIVRSVVFFGVNTFIELYWIHHLGASRGVAGAALACFLVGGVAGTLLGGRIADRLGLVRALQIGTVTMVPALVALRVCPDAGIALAAAAAAGLAVNIPFAVMIKLGQDYLPSRPGTAAGITLGLAVSIGGLFAPVLGAIAEARGIAAVFTVLCFVPGLALILGAFLPDPAAPAEGTADARSRRALEGRRG